MVGVGGSWRWVIRTHTDIIIIMHAVPPVVDMNI